MTEEEDLKTWRRRHDKRWCVLMIIAMGVSLILIYPLNVIQFIMCGLSLAVRVPRMLK
jgi:hypothetical protein